MNPLNFHSNYTPRYQGLNFKLLLLFWAILGIMHRDMNNIFSRFLNYNYKSDASILLL